MPETKAKPKPVTVFVNNRPIKLADRDTTGAEIKKAADVPLDFKLYGPQGDEIEDDEAIRVHARERFIAISGQDVS
jgi:hypothetical protein